MTERKRAAECKGSLALWQEADELASRLLLLLLLLLLKARGEAQGMSDEGFAILPSFPFCLRLILGISFPAATATAAAADRDRAESWVIEAGMVGESLSCFKADLLAREERQRAAHGS